MSSSSQNFRKVYHREYYIVQAYNEPITPLDRVLLENLIVSQLDKIFFVFYGNLSFIIVFTRACHF